jgi:hypothetical protein
MILLRLFNRFNRCVRYYANLLKYTVDALSGFAGGRTRGGHVQTIMQIVYPGRQT